MSVDGVQGPNRTGLREALNVTEVTGGRWFRLCGQGLMRLPYEVQRFLV
ncbi:hypothetical protein ACVINH_006889 [Rhizobium anhuiense]